MNTVALSIRNMCILSRGNHFLTPMSHLSCNEYSMGIPIQSFGGYCSPWVDDPWFWHNTIPVPNNIILTWKHPSIDAPPTSGNLPESPFAMMDTPIKNLLRPFFFAQWVRFLLSISEKHSGEGKKLTSIQAYQRLIDVDHTSECWSTFFNFNDFDFLSLPPAPPVEVIESVPSVVCVCVSLWDLHCATSRGYRTSLCTTNLRCAPPTCVVHHGAQGGLCQDTMWHHSMM